jgi:hypothetical protein
MPTVQDVAKVPFKQLGYLSSIPGSQANDEQGDSFFPLYQGPEATDAMSSLSCNIMISYFL